MVVVVGTTGQTRRRDLKWLTALPNASVVANIRNVAKGEKTLGGSSTVVRGAMVQKVPSLDTAGVKLKTLHNDNDLCYDSYV